MEPWSRVILHADMDAFFAAVEQRDRPELRGMPVVVGGMSRRGVVSTASYEARPFGVHSAMPTEQARKLCPQAVFLPPDFRRYKEASDRIMEVFSSFSPKVEPLSLDEAFLDLAGTERLFGPPETAARKLKDAVREATAGLTVSVGAAPCKFVAKVASDFQKPDGLTVVPPSMVQSFLGPLGVERLWGVGVKTIPLLHRLRLKTIGDVAQADPDWLERRLGSLGPHISSLARGEDPREVISEREAKSIGAEETMERDVTGVEAILPHLRRSAGRIARDLRREGLIAGGVRVKLKTAAFRLWTRQSALNPPTDSELELFRAGVALLPEFDLSVPMRLVGMAAFRMTPAAGAGGQQPSLFEDEERAKRRTVEKTVDALRERFGNGAAKWGDEG